MYKKGEIEVVYIDHMGGDLSVVNSARVSFDKKKEIFDEKDKKLIAYLAKNDHWSPFAHTSVQMKFSAPIFLARQLAKHQVGGVWNEVSRRYIDKEPSFYVPKDWRKRSDNKKQGSSDEIVEVNVDDFLSNSLNTYNSLLTLEVAPELARMVLPQNMITEWYWTGSLIFWKRVYLQRVDEHAQKEHKLITKSINEICSKLFPVSWEALISN